MDNSFIKYSAQEWLEIIKKDLGPETDISRFYPPSREGIQLDPFAHSPESQYDPIQRNPNPWKITALVDTADAADANKQALYFLQNGASALKIILHEGQKLESILKDVILEYVSIILDTRNIKNSNDIVKELSENYPTFQGHILSQKIAKAPQLQDDDMPVSMLANILNNQIDRENLENTTIVEMQIGKHFLVEIAKLRSLRILWANLLKTLDEPEDKSLVILAVPKESCLVEDENTALIQLTYMAMSSIIGGADFVLTNTHNNSSKNYQRTALHIQNILQMESNFGMVSDPAAGSYVIEDLTNKLASHTWNQIN